MSIRTLFYFVFIAALWSSCGLPITHQKSQFSNVSATLNNSDREEPRPAYIDQSYSTSREGAFTKNVLVNNLNEPTEFEILRDGKVLFTQRRGTLMLLDPKKDALIEVAQLDVHTKFEDGLMGLALDPNYDDNNWIYLYYSPASTHPDSQNEDYVPTTEESKQHLSRFIYKDGVLDKGSEIVLLEVQTQRIECCHTGGSIEFGPDGNLFLSTGDDVNPFASDGYGPIDEQPGRSPWDGQTTSANTNDLRGKILRITPQPDGTYTIPDGNLFAVGTEKARPEIYVMGNRNPYRISIDQKTGYLYWGEVGPDAKEDNPTRGPRGHDEINQARQAGNFGWPQFVADNRPYNDYNFATKESGAPFDPMAPVNDSPNNSGLRELPPAQKAFIWYPYGESPEFPVLGSGGRNAMAGPVFYKDDFQEGPHSFPADFDGKLFIYDWIRGWIMTVTMDANSDLVRIDPFMPDVEFSNPIDMQFDEEGVLYVMEYGKGWFSQNQDARISRIEYNPQGVSASDSEIAEGVSGRDAHARNTAPVVGIELEGNRSFFFADEVRAYSVRVSDPEDGSLEDGGIKAEEVLVHVDYLPMGYDKTLIAQGHQLADNVQSQFLEGKEIMDQSDCAGCHALDRTSIGPTYRQVAEKYAHEPDAEAYLIDKIKNGGAGVWGERAMAAHPQLSDDELKAIVDYILSVKDSSVKEGRMGVSGAITLNEHLTLEGKEGTYYIRAAYTDKGGEGLNPVMTEETVVLRHPRVQAEAFDVSDNIVSRNDAVIVYSGSYLGLKNIDLSGITSLTCLVKRGDKESAGGAFEVRLGSSDGELIGQMKVGGKSLTEGGHSFTIPLDPQEGTYDVYIVAQNDRTSETNLLVLDWVEFNK